MTVDEQYVASRRASYWRQWFASDQGRRAPNKPSILADMELLVEYVAHLENVVSTTKPLTHSRPGWWDGFLKMIGLRNLES